MLSNKGFTIVEVLVALFLFSFLMLGLLGGFLKTYQYQAKNEFRNEAIKLAEQELEKYRNLDYSAITPVSNDCTSSTEKIQRQIRNAYIEYTIAREITEEIPNSVKKIVITVCWNYKGKSYNYSAETLIANY